jgi:hypothetical protein
MKVTKMKRLILLSSLLCAWSATAVAQESLGSVTIGRSVTADGKTLAAGTYQVRLTPDQAQPIVPGQQLERWIEFVQGGQVRGREVASIVSDADLAEVTEGPRPARNGSRVELLKENDYLRVWLNHDGNNYLLHLPVGG